MLACINSLLRHILAGRLARYTTGTKARMVGSLGHESTLAGFQLPGSQRRFRGRNLAWYGHPHDGGAIRWRLPQASRPTAREESLPASSGVAPSPTAPSHFQRPTLPLASAHRRTLWIPARSGCSARQATGRTRATTNGAPTGGGNTRGELRIHEGKGVIVMQSFSSHCSASTVSDLHKGAHTS